MVACRGLIPYTAPMAHGPTHEGFTPSLPGLAQRVMLVSNNPAHIAAIEAAVRVDGRAIRVEPTVERGLRVAREWGPRAMLLDLGLGLTAGGLAAFLRDPVVSACAGVIAVSGREHFSLVGPSVPVADVVAPPLDPDEVRLRLSRLLWTTDVAGDGHRVRRGGLAIDMERYQVSVDGEVVDLTYKEYELLCFLATNPGKAYTREALLNRVWGYDYYGGSRTVDVHVRRIRSKIERGEPFIETVRNVGYRFVEPPQAASEGARR